MFVKITINTKSKTNLLQTGAQTHTGAAYDKNNNNNNNTKKDGRDETTDVRKTATRTDVKRKRSSALHCW